MPVQECLGGLGRICLHEAPVAVGQVQDKAVGFPLDTADDHQGLAEVALGVSRRMGQRHEHLLGLAAVLSYIVLDYGVLTVEPVLIPQPLEDALYRVALLPGTLRSSSRIRSMTLVKGSSFGFLGGDCRR